MLLLLLLVQDYDTQSQILYGPCVAAANAPYYGMMRGIDRYRQMGVPVDKLILGVPWYGYRYPCINDDDDASTAFVQVVEDPTSTSTDNGQQQQHDEYHKGNVLNFGQSPSTTTTSIVTAGPPNFLCRIAPKPFRGIPCSDAAGRQFPYVHMVQLMLQNNLLPEWDDNQQSPYLTVYEQEEEHPRQVDSTIQTSNATTTSVSTQEQFKQKPQLYQYWFDDPASLRAKYAWARQVGVRGVGPYAFYDVGHEVPFRPLTEAMWTAFDVFLDGDEERKNKDDIMNLSIDIRRKPE